MLLDSEVEALVQGLFVPHWSDECYKTLETVAPSSVPYLLAAMKDPSVLAGGTLPPIGLPDFQSPLYRISSLLVQSNSPDAAAPFLDMIAHPELRIRLHGASHLAELAQTNCIEAVTRLLASEDKELRNYTLIGIGHARKAKRGAPEL